MLTGCTDSRNARELSPGGTSHGTFSVQIANFNTSHGTIKVQEADMNYKKEKDGAVASKRTHKDRKSSERNRAELKCKLAEWSDNEDEVVPEETRHQMPSAAVSDAAESLCMNGRALNEKTIEVSPSSSPVVSSIALPTS
jgi:hypothetical protein